MTFRDLVKYFIHGIAFSLLFLLIAIGWAFILVILVSLGFIIGLLIGLAVLFLFVGLLNSFLTRLLWFEVEDGFWNLLFHGFVLFILLLIVDVFFVLIPNLAFPNIATNVVTFVIAAFLDGFIAKIVAARWRVMYRESV